MRPVFGNPAKSGSGRISCGIWQMSLQLQYVQLIADKTNTAYLSSGVFFILVSVTRMLFKIQNALKNWQTLT